MQTTIECLIVKMKVLVEQAKKATPQQPFCENLELNAYQECLNLLEDSLPSERRQLRQIFRVAQIVEYVVPEKNNSIFIFDSIDEVFGKEM